MFVPHRSFQVYLDFDYDAIENELLPILGSRNLLRAEERNQPRNQYYLLQKAGIRMPRQFKSPSQIDRLAIVKVSEKERKFERAFFFASSAKDYEAHAAKLLKEGKITKQALEEAVIEEFALGTQVNFNYFYSPLRGEVELLGTDFRRQTNIDGILRLPADQQARVLELVQPKLEESGHVACTILESMLEVAMELGERFALAIQKEYAPGIIGPFALQSAVLPGPPKKDVVVFDVSLRMPGSPGTRFTPYTEYLHGESLSAGRRLARELKTRLRQKT